MVETAHNSLFLSYTSITQQLVTPETNEKNSGQRYTVIEMHIHLKMYKRYPKYKFSCFSGEMSCVINSLDVT